MRETYVPGFASSGSPSASRRARTVHSAHSCGISSTSVAPYAWSITACGRRREFVGSPFATTAYRGLATVRAARGRYGYVISGGMISAYVCEHHVRCNWRRSNMTRTRTTSDIEAPQQCATMPSPSLREYSTMARLEVHVCRFAENRRLKYTS